MIIIVDDDYDIASLFKISLAKAALYASSFTDPEIALEEFRSRPTNYVLVISDIRMPAMNGYELAQQVNKIKPDVKVLLTSAFEYDYYEQYFGKVNSKLYIDGFVEKPISLNKLRAIVIHMLDHRLQVPTQQGIADWPL